MSKYLASVILISITIFLLTGCGTTQPEQPKEIKNDEIIKQENGTYKIKIFDTEISDKYAYLNRRVALKKALIKAIEITEKENKKEFALLQPNANTLKGFPLNTFIDLQEYCANMNKCGFNFENSFFTLNIIPVENVPYEIAIININSLKRELNLK